jgi:transcriptional regulator with XRE-family HTH domain
MKRVETNYRDEDLLKAIGEKKIRLVRKSKGFTQEGFANFIEVDYSQINRMELGKVNVTVSMLSRIAIALEVPMQSLLP